MKRIATLLLASAFAVLLFACEPAHQNIVDTAEPLDTAHPGVKEAPGVEENAPPGDTAATETAAQQSTRTQ